MSKSQTISSHANHIAFPDYFDFGTKRIHADKYLSHAADILLVFVLYMFYVEIKVRVFQDSITIKLVFCIINVSFDLPVHSQNMFKDVI